MAFWALRRRVYGFGCSVSGSGLRDQFKVVGSGVECAGLC